ncbi:MAG: LysM peptidoglycan-binding domain-containing protein [Methylohalobius crimeensis]
MHAFRVFVIALALGSAVIAQAKEIPLAQDHPQRYTVVKGDTLWDIAARFLKNPWQWPKIWKANPQIENPHWIYPGDVLTLKYIDGQPRLVLQRHETEKLQPQIRETSLDEAIPTIPYEAVRQFLTTPRVVTQEEIEEAPYIVSLRNNRLIGGNGDTIYVRGLENHSDAVRGYTIFRQDEPLRDPETKEILGYNALYVADAHLERSGDPASLSVSRSVREVLVGDRLLPIAREALAMDYYPHPPAEKIEGHIIEVMDGVSQLGQYNLVVIDRGRQDGLEKGHVLDIWRHGVKVLDSVGKRASEWVTLPDEKSGLILIFRPFERVSYGIIMKATYPIHLGDLVKKPLL